MKMEQIIAPNQSNNSVVTPPTPQQLPQPFAGGGAFAYADGGFTFSNGPTGAVPRIRLGPFVRYGRLGPRRDSGYF